MGITAMTSSISVPTSSISDHAGGCAWPPSPHSIAAACFLRSPTTILAPPKRSVRSCCWRSNGRFRTRRSSNKSRHGDCRIYARKSRTSTKSPRPTRFSFSQERTHQSRSLFAGSRQGPARFRFPTGDPSRAGRCRSCDCRCTLCLHRLRHQAASGLVMTIRTAQKRLRS